ncbi:MAG: hypothetical protein AAFX41_06905 [Bacteroidota bacterium]
MNLPDLKHDYSNAVVLDASWGPRREVTLTLGLWPLNGQGRPLVSYRLGESDPVRIRFGGIANYDEAEAFFREELHEGNGLHYLRHAEGSKPTALRIEFQWDRNDAKLTICCQNVTVSERGELS